MTILTDEEIEALCKEEKVLPKDYHKKLRTKGKSGLQHEEQELTIQGKQGNTFTIILRKNRIDFHDFSIILRYKNDKTGKWYNLARYNGKHSHTNPLEKESFHDFHVHLATQKYQEAGLRVETYACVDTTYKSFGEAVDAFLTAFNFQIELPENVKTLKDFGGD